MKNIYLAIPFIAYLIFILTQLYRVLKNKEANTAIEFSKGTGNYASKIIFLTVIATMIGPGFSYGAIDKFASTGFFYTIFYLLAMLQFWLFGHFFAGRIQETKEETVGDLMGNAYGKSAQVATGILTVLFSIAIVAVISVGGGKVIASVFDYDLKLSIIFVVGFITLYSLFGGISAVIKTDKLQFWLIIIFVIIGIYSAIVFLFQNDLSLLSIDREKLWNVNLSTSEIIGVSIAFFLGEAFIPVYSIRGLIAKNPSTARRAFKKVAWFGLVFFVLLTFIGIISRYAPSSSELTYLNLTYEVLGNEWGYLLIGIAVTGMISVVMSTLDSILNAGGVSLRKDIIQVISKVNEEQKLGYTRFAILIIALSGLVLTIFENDIVNLLLIGYTIWVPTVTFPLAYYLLKKKVYNKSSGILGILFGCIGWYLFNEVFIIGFPPILAGLLFNISAFLLSENLSKKNEKLA